MYRPAYVAALNLLARACRIVLDRGLPPPILVGGAVVEFDTAGLMFSGDLDLVSSADEAVNDALLAVGFRREDRPGWKRGGFYHPDLPIGVELVSGGYFDGQADRARVRVVAVPDGRVFMAPTEDLIADRLGQWIASGRRDREVLEQALEVLGLAHDLDAAYLDARIRQETAGELGLDALRALGDEAHEP